MIVSPSTLILSLDAWTSGFWKLPTTSTDKKMEIKIYHCTRNTDILHIDSFSGGVGDIWERISGYLCQHVLWQE
ncbi:hypothetical protein AOXY_G7539 [Acipenser oxyrinchus oxyrinchus]|uniref:Uncharacterized protein n=1 Tax=Acipenser oxyrinchus oxyrinchus TaxID=40147 RepID=A0AAD8GAG3_ACIOX|nr:hypothetical protein AOXY_G7539 [Acipenser oxyrinchus oxyrinchus]